MRYRKLTRSGDMTFGHAAADFYQDQPEAVAQAVVTRLRLWTGDWFLDTAEGTNWLGAVLGTNTRGTADLELRGRIGETTGLAGVTSYASARDGETRAFAVRATIDTIYGTITLAAPVGVQAPTTPWPQALTTLLGFDSDTLLGVDGQVLIGANDPTILVYV